MNTKDFKRWSDKVQVGTKDDCWEWTGERNERGYGRMKIDGKNKKAHRLSYEHFTGRQLGKLLCCHTCDNPGCVNPHHLWSGTQKDNIQDCVRKGRHNPHSTYGIPPANKILSDSDCDLIRRFPSYRRGSINFLSRWFGVSTHHIKHIRHGQYRAPAGYKKPSYVRPLDAHVVDLICRFPPGYGRGSFLARWFGVSRQTICHVRKGRY